MSAGKAIAGRVWSERQEALFAKYGRAHWQRECADEEISIFRDQLRGLNVTAGLAEGVDQLAAREAAAQEAKAEEVASDAERDAAAREAQVRQAKKDAAERAAKAEADPIKEPDVEEDEYEEAEREAKNGC